MTPNRLLLIAQSPVLRYGIQTLVESNGPVGEVAEAGNALDVYGIAPRFAPDLVIVQDALPGVTGMLSARMIRQLTPATHVIVLADDVELAERAAGGTDSVDALLPMAIEPDELTETIRRFERAESETPMDDVPALEIALLDGLARGMSLQAIAAAIDASHDALADGLRALLARFDASNRAELFANVVRRGWIDPHVQPPAASPPISFAVAA